MSKRHADENGASPLGRRPKFGRTGVRYFENSTENASGHVPKKEQLDADAQSKPSLCQPKSPHERSRKTAMATLFTKPPVSSTTGMEGQRVNIISNYFGLKKCDRWTLYKHHIDFEPAEDRTFMRKVLMRQHKSEFSGYLFDGSTLFTIRIACPNGEPLVLKSTKNNGEEVTLTVKFVGTCEPLDFEYLQVFNIIMRDCLACLKLQLIRRNYFDPAAKIDIHEHKLELWSGYNISMSQCQEATLLRVEILFKTLRTETVYDVMKSMQKEQTGGNLKINMSTALIGLIVLTRYNNRTYRIEDLDFLASPQTTFKIKKRGEEKDISFQDYYLERYNIRIKDSRQQPLLIAKSNTRDRSSGKTEFITLIPELCIMTGLTDQMRSNFQLMKAVANHTSINPGDRVKRLMNFNARLNQVPEIKCKLKNHGLELEPNLLQIPGRILSTETIVYGNNQTFKVGQDSDWTKALRSNSMLLNAQLKSWVLICPNRFRREGENFVNILLKCGDGMQFIMGRPTLHSIPDDRTVTYVQALDDVINKHDPELVVCIVSNNRSDRYSAIKKKCILDRKVPSQVVTCKTLGHKSLTSIATKIAIQINSKLGGVAWGVQIPLKGLMVAGFDVCRDPKQKRFKYSATVTTMDLTCTRYYSAVSHHGESNVELSDNFVSNFMKGVEKFRLVNQSLPKWLVIFREGVSEGDLHFVYEHEVQILKQSLAKLYEDVALKLCFIVVTKKINTRLMVGDRNPSPGTVVDSVITNPRRYEFYLVSQCVRFGTVSPTHYNVLEDTTGLKPDHIQRLTYKFTHLYFNWSGTVRVPAPIQYAHKLAFLTSQFLGSTHASMDHLLYFL